MLRQSLIFIIFIFVSISLMGCNERGDKTDNSNISTIDVTTKSQINSEINTSNEADKRIDPEILKRIVVDLNSINIKNCWAGYDGSGNISVWVDSSDKNKHVNVDIDSPEYDAFLAKKIFERCTNIENVYSMVKANAVLYSLYKIKRGEYLESGLKDAPSEPEIFDALEINWHGKMNMHFIIDNLVVQEGEKYDPQIAFKRLIQELLWDRLVEARTEYYFMGAIEAIITVNGLPQNISVTDEIAKIIVLGMGRFSEKLPFDNIYNMEITYKNNEENIFKVTMLRGHEQDTSQQFIGWLTSGLNPKEWVKYAEKEIYNKNFKLPDVADNAKLYPETKYEDPGYEKVLNTLKEFKGVKDLLLGYDGTKYNALVTMEHSSDIEDFKNEMAITLEAMKYPFETMWFMAEDSNGTEKNMALIDRERFNILMYMNDSGSFDFTPEEWPIMVKAYGEA